MSEKLSRSLTFIGLLGFGFNIMIGSGMFFLPGRAMAIMGPASILAVMAALAIAALLVFCFAELSNQFTQTGGPILYTHATLGPAAAFGVGWLGYLSRVSSNAALVVIFATSAVTAFPTLSGQESVLIAALSDSPVADAALSIMGPAGHLIGVGILLSVIGVNLSCALATPRYLYAMSLEGSLPRVFARVSFGGQVPYVAVLLSSGLTYVLTIGNSYVALAVLSVIARIVQYMASCIALLILRHRQEPGEIRFRAPAGRLLAAAALLVCVWLLLSATRSQLLWTAVALLAGYVLYYANKALAPAHP